MNSTEKLLKPVEAAEFLAICPRKLHELTKQGEIKCVRMGRSLRYDPDDLRDYIERCKAAESSVYPHESSREENRRTSPTNRSIKKAARSKIKTRPGQHSKPSAA
jgi:excisionase family DNA binding protein